ncbi:hypothetical protein [Ellagibacter isourolithinifaciens]|uniref:hypothetical protein n=1 Tax=Ellagibacter isourolithinifaciens TaxID=2137581 RepID=UPI003A9405ED
MAGCAPRPTTQSPGEEHILPGARFPYIWLDAICIKSSGEGRAKSTAPVTVT